jgi:hypothetical protein
MRLAPRMMETDFKVARNEESYLTKEGPGVIPVTGIFVDDSDGLNSVVGCKN